MIGTIGSLVQETSHRLRWLLASSLYTIACISSSLLLGALLGGAGHSLLQFASNASSHSWVEKGSALLVGLLALAYACSDLRFIHLPRPSVLKAVPITWWRRWKPYRAALAYGAALGVGIMTRIGFGAFYVLCAWCLLQGNVISGALLMGTYGLARALTLFPASWYVYRRGADHQTRLGHILDKAEFAQQGMALVLLLLSIEIISSFVGL
jgi:sulfite exporter TauE/SafE